MRTCWHIVSNLYIYFFEHTNTTRSKLSYYKTLNSLDSDSLVIILVHGVIIVHGDVGMPVYC
jgi:hypothetical protein